MPLSKFAARMEPRNIDATFGYIENRSWSVPILRQVRMMLDVGRLGLPDGSLELSESAELDS